MTTNRTCRCTRSWLLMVVACVALRHVEAFSYSSPFQTNHRFSSAPRSTKTAIHLFSVPKATLISTVGHVMGGVTGTPTVVQGTQKGGWYRRIVFAPVWTLLYSMMGVAFSRVGRAAGFGSPVALLWLFHYALNLSWAPVFFGRQRLRLALWINWGLLATLSVIIPWFWKIDCLAGALLIPYAAWLLFATALNAKICRLNPTVNGYNEAKFQAGLLNLQKRQPLTPTHRRTKRSHGCMCSQTDLTLRLIIQKPFGCRSICSNAKIAKNIQQGNQLLK